MPLVCFSEGSPQVSNSSFANCVGLPRFTPSISGLVATSDARAAAPSASSFSCNFTARSLDDQIPWTLARAICGMHRASISAACCCLGLNWCQNISPSRTAKRVSSLQRNSSCFNSSGSCVAKFLNSLNPASAGKNSCIAASSLYDLRLVAGTSSPSGSTTR